MCSVGGRTARRVARHVARADRGGRHWSHSRGEHLRATHRAAPTGAEVESSAVTRPSARRKRDVRRTCRASRVQVRDRAGRGRWTRRFPGARLHRKRAFPTIGVCRNGQSVLLVWGERPPRPPERSGTRAEIQPRTRRDEHPTDLRPHSSPPDRPVVPFDHASGVDHNGGGHAMLPTNQEYLVRAKRTIDRFRVFQTAASAAHDARRRVCTRETVDFFFQNGVPIIFIFLTSARRRNTNAPPLTNPKRPSNPRSVRTRRTVTPPRITAAR